MAKSQGGQAWWKRAWGFMKDVGISFGEDRAALAAASVAFYLTLALIPLLLLIVSVAAFFVEPETARAQLAQLTEGLGAIGATIQSEVLSVVENRGILSGLSLLVALWAGSQIFAFIIEAMNHVWDVEESRPFWRKRGLALVATVGFGILVGIAIILVYFVQFIRAFEGGILGGTIGLTWLASLLFSIIIPLLIITFIFAVVYYVMPNRDVSWRIVWPGALAAGVIWLIVLHVFSWYTVNFADYSVLYGSLGGLILLMLFFNYSAQIMLLGAEISAVYHRRLYKAGKIDQRWGEKGPT